MLEMAEWVQKSRHYLRLHFPEPRCPFPSSVTFDLSLEDLIQGLGDTSWVLVEGWEGGACRKVKSQLPSLGLGHVWGTTYVPSSLWKQAVASLSMTCMKSDPDRFHPFSSLASYETSLVSLGEYIYIWLSCHGTFAVFPNQVSNTYLKHSIKMENTLEGIWNASLLHETWHHGLFMGRLIEDCPLLQATSWDQDWFRFPSQVFLQHLGCPAMWLCSCLSFWNPH